MGKIKLAITSNKFIVINLSIIIFFIVIGIGYATWNYGLAVSNLISTGGIDTVFDRCEIVEETDPSPEANANVSNIQISDDGKKIDIVIDNAYPGYSAVIKYSIKNNGDIPLYCKVTNGAQDFASIEINNPAGVVEANGGSVEGTFKITVLDGAEENKAYDLVLNLDYVQYNEMQ